MPKHTWLGKIFLLFGCQTTPSSPQHTSPSQKGKPVEVAYRGFVGSLPHLKPEKTTITITNQEQLDAFVTMIPTEGLNKKTSAPNPDPLLTQPNITFDHDTLIIFLRSNIGFPPPQLTDAGVVDGQHLLYVHYPPQAIEAAQPMNIYQYTGFLVPRTEAPPHIITQ